MGTWMENWDGEMRRDTRIISSVSLQIHLLSATRDLHTFKTITIHCFLSFTLQDHLLITIDRYSNIHAKGFRFDHVVTMYHDVVVMLHY